MAEAQLAEVAADGHLALPAEAYARLNLGPGMRLKLLAAEEDMLVMRLVSPRQPLSSVGEADLLLQQAALSRVWDDPAEDLYNDDV
ncbi:MAG: hypothetical protein COZ06_38215 [Armatimonadetes bacterium CG_4_10_14_3_um_filter_66_18]|nr:hypothetical protein [Armatimonadota bacterium]OIP08331.1 MAG: hypothetical protein AUJ96_06245 [Armatimonadetes bacterium CG2_30_66_41]PIU94270.1 MAG: hypothetical protein COS65_08500 [Armatimonadetes bacterium CG06_land_8_20_14_3_00_66_21]PIX42025.1 MAG: hypothetical protein COZ57_22120 [Armatimonadetes bacterium CG_4_8_14_3_um_filter_66_20]PIY35388.1 MAG: hypothetical protein COZ06_38215 [Armatimonadetes bacterium CG_4_10_14_3_um_filter_66_18]PIZ45790.1 MAG: hypothetical protein COY42_11